MAALSLALALLLPPAFLIALVGYSCLSLSYSLYLKRKLMVDVVALAALYGIRVLAGSAVTGIVLSQWLVGFCFFIFLSLALMKRTTEIILLPEASEDNIKGRGYRRADLPVLNALTVASGFVGVLVLALYINSPDVTILYQRPDLLWGICIALVYWLGRAFFPHRPWRNATGSCHFRCDGSKQPTDRTGYHSTISRRHLIVDEFPKASAVSFCLL